MSTSLRDTTAYKKFDLVQFGKAPLVRVRSLDIRLILLLFVLTLVPLVKVTFPFWTYFDVGPFEPEDVIETIPNDIKFLDEPRLPKKVDVLVMINSQVDETNLRRDIRRSWGNSTNFDSEMTTVVFVLGKPNTEEQSRILNKEIHKYHDLLITDLEEDYYSLALKTYTMLYYKSKRLPTTKCLVKADSDNVLHLFNYELLCAPVILGKCNVDRRVKRKNSKWAVPYNLYELSRWPKYCSTGTYALIGRDVPQRILAAAVKTPFFSSVNYRRLPEDVLFTGIFAEIANIRRKTIPGVSFRDQPIYKCRDVKYTHSIHMHRRKDPIYYYKRMLSLEGGMCLI